MKKLYTIGVISFAALLGFQSCSKELPGELIASPSSPEIQVIITANQTYQFALDNSVSTGILKQASHYRVSHTELDQTNGLMIYRYMPAANYTGTDEVVLSTIKAVSTARTGCGNSQRGNGNDVTYTTSYTTLKIIVIEK